MTQEIPVVLDPSLGVDPADLKAAWDADSDAWQLGSLETRPTTQQFTGFLELVVIPIVVGVSTDFIRDALKKLMAAKVKEPMAVEKHTLPGGQEAVVVQKK
jgi:hypothetical protein